MALQEVLMNLMLASWYGLLAAWADWMMIIDASNIKEEKSFLDEKASNFFNCSQEGYDIVVSE